MPSCSIYDFLLVFLQEARKTVPNLWNLNEDPMLSGMIVHLTPPGVAKIGNAEPADILVKGLG